MIINFLRAEGKNREKEEKNPTTTLWNIIKL